LISNHFGDSVGGPEKAGVGGSIPSLATIISNNLTTLKERVKFSRTYNTRTLSTIHASQIGSNNSKLPAPCGWFWRYAAAPPK